MWDCEENSHLIPIYKVFVYEGADTGGMHKSAHTPTNICVEVGRKNALYFRRKNVFNWVMCGINSLPEKLC